MDKIFSSDVISILVPTRKRPENVIRLIESAEKTANNPEKLEFVFYVDHDDLTFPILNTTIQVKIVKGPRVWLSIIQNILFANSTGDLLMYAADDIVFLSQDWDLAIKREFENFEDRILLVFGNDLGSHGKSIAIHGFLHRRWIETVGAFAAPFRLSLTDLWHTENARIIDRLVYLPDLMIKHIHYRQGGKEATFDQTYMDVYAQSSVWRPFLTYKKLSRERRIDRLLLGEVMKSKPKIEAGYMLAEIISKYLVKLGYGSEKIRRIKSINNLSIIVLLIKYPLKFIIRRSNEP